MALVVACKEPAAKPPASPYVLVLGVAQDAGYPQAGCQKSCCTAVWEGKTARKHVASLAVIDPASGQRWLIDATPDFRDQLRRLDELVPVQAPAPGLDAIFLTHAHIGHYTGLMHLGREVMGASGVPVYAMPRMKQFLENNGPWDLLVRLHNIELRPLQADRPVQMSPRLRITPLLVPHRQEYSETVGYRIDGPNRSVLYIPDIDKWERWDRRIEDEIARVDAALLDGTFFDDGEVPGRDMSEIPHPFIRESLRRFASLAAEERDKIYFIHLNHTNPALGADSRAAAAIHAAGFHVAQEEMQIGL